MKTDGQEMWIIVDCIAGNDITNALVAQAKKPVLVTANSRQRRQAVEEVDVDIPEVGYHYKYPI